MVDARRGELGPFDAERMRVSLDDRVIDTTRADAIDFRRRTPRTQVSK